MNKKILILLALVFSALSIMFIAVWGTLPENTNRIPVETIAFNDYDVVNEDGDKLKDVTGIVTENNYIYILDYTIFPGNAYADQITVTSASTAVTVQIDTSNYEISAYYDLTVISQKPTVTIRIMDQSTQNYDEITLIFKTPGTIIVPDFN
jgi:hypothetical protein